MTADALKKITTDALDTLAALLDEGHSDQLTALLKTMARFSTSIRFYVILNIARRMSARGLCEVDGEKRNVDCWKVVADRT